MNEKTGEYKIKLRSSLYLHCTYKPDKSQLMKKKDHNTRSTGSGMASMDNPNGEH